VQFLCSLTPVTLGGCKIQGGRIEVMSMFNWFKKFFCKLPEHDGVVTYVGMSVLGKKCSGCGYKWYEKKRFGEQ